MDLRLATLKTISLYLLHNVSNNAESFPVSQLCVNTLPATKITLITNGIEFSSLRVKPTPLDFHFLDIQNSTTWLISKVRSPSFLETERKIYFQ
jgi:hypothetical protein